MRPNQLAFLRFLYVGFLPSLTLGKTSFFTQSIQMVLSSTTPKDFQPIPQRVKVLEPKISALKM
jgi:hypothetical protein